MLFVVLALHAVVGLAALASGRRLGRGAVAVGALPLLAVWAWVGARAGDVVDDGVADRLEWVPQLGLALDVRVDAFALLMLVLVSGIGALVFAYAWSYFGHSPKAPRVAGLLTLFAGAMFGVVVADNVLFLYVCWELTSITSYLLIGTDDDDPEVRASALHALLVTGLGGLVMLAGLVLLGIEAGTWTLSELLADPPTGRVAEIAVVLVLVGAFTKSAQYPFHSWLPDAMAAPTPISAYLHSAAMVKAGVYVVARFAPAFADAGVWRPLVVTVGLTTMIAGGLRAMRPFDLKRLLAFGTISQLGFLVVLFGIGRSAATAAGCALLLAHALFKAALFMVIGIVDHQVHTRDLRDLPMLGPGWAATKVVAVVSAASMAAIPPLAGFIAKEQAYAALVNGSTSDRVVLAGIVVGSVFTVAYSARLLAALLRPSLVGGAAPPVDPAVRPPAWAFVAPAAVLAGGTAALGIVPALWSWLIDDAAHALDHRSHAHLALWHGVNTPLVLSAVTIALGLGVFAARRPLASLQTIAPATTGADIYGATVRVVLRFAAWVTRVVQSGSLRVYTTVIMTTAAVAPLVALTTGAWWPGWPDTLGSPGHVPVGALLAGAGFAATLARRRFAAALLLGVVGYGMALLFVVQGAPDLALTQFTVETLSTVVFLLVLRQLPDRFQQPAPVMSRALRVAVAAAVGVLVTLMAIAAAGSRTARPVSTEMAEQALPEGHGRNIVNVILVDIRGMDTMGEITVLVAAGLGIVSLARLGRRPRRWTTRRPGGGLRTRIRRRRPAVGES